MNICCKMKKKIVIIGAGPTGLGASYRLRELSYPNFEIFEKNNYVGGLSASFFHKGFTWDIGGHVIFSHYDYFDNLFEKLMRKEYLEHMRESWIWLENTFIPYPFQNNIKYLSPDKILECILGLIDVQKHKHGPKNFKEWLYSVFGKGIADIFLIPDNSKRWSYPLGRMDMKWIAERISVIDLKRILKNIILNIDDLSWGPNNKFKFPLKGGTGGFFNRFIPFIKDNLHCKKELVKIDIGKKRLFFSDKTTADYDILITTMPLDRFVKLAGLKRFQKDITNICHNDEFIVGIGIKQLCPSAKCWMYFPENNCPFYRVTYFSNYSPNNVPSKQHYSLMCETTYSDYKKMDKKKIIDETVQGLVNVKLIREKDKKDIVTKHLIDAKYAYPIPTLGRDKALKKIQAFLLRNNIYSRGRFGAWKYEIGNMDHSVMQGVEAVNKIVLGEKEKTWIL